MKITSSIYLLPNILLLIIITELCAVDDPCPNEIDSKIVADMCTGDQAVEDSIDGTYVNDSVMVRVMKQKANCECRVSLINNTSNYSVLMRRYRGLGRVVPPTQNCGLAIDVHYHKVTGSERNLDPIKCRNGTKCREIGIEKNGVIKLKSKIISGNFTRGYCMQIYRKNGADGLNVKLKIQCDDPDKTTTKGYNEEDQKLEVYIYIGAGAGGLLMMISILLILLCIRNRSTKKRQKEEETANDSNDTDSDNGKLKDNILYVSSDPQDIIEDGNYSTVDLENKRIVNESTSSGVEDSTADGNYSSIGTTDSSPDTRNKPKPAVNFNESDKQRQYISTLENSSNEYAVVDKGRQSGGVKHATPLEVKNSSEKDTEMSVIDQTYAVVDKANRKKADE